MTPLAHIVASHRAAKDPGCAGCAQLGTFRALRRAGLEVSGGLGCDPDAAPAVAPAWGRWAAVTGIAALRRRGAPRFVAEAVEAGARMVVVADRATRRESGVEALLDAAGVPVVRIDPADLAGAEGEIARLADGGEAAVVIAMSPCARGARSGAAVTIAAARCNRCGACLVLGCPALSDSGEAMVVDPGVCTGCGMCVGLCRGKAIGTGAR